MERSRQRAISGSHFEQLVDELDLSPNIRTAHPPRLSLPNHVHRLITLNRSVRGLELSESLLGVHTAFDRSMVLFQDVIQVLRRSVPATPTKRSFLLYVRDGRSVDRRLIRVDNPGLRMACIAQGLAKETFGGIGVAQRRKQKVNRGSSRIDDSIQVAPATTHSNIYLIDTPGLVRRLQLSA